MKWVQIEKEEETKQSGCGPQGTRNEAQFSLTPGQANKSARGMPWHQEPMKDVTSCDKLRGAANKL